MVVELARDLIRTQDQLGPQDNVNLVFKLFNQKIPSVYATVKLPSTNIGHAFIVGHSVNGIVGTALGIDGQQIVVGSQALGATTTQRVISLNNTFVEGFRDTEYIDTDETSATIDTTLFKVTF